MLWKGFLVFLYELIETTNKPLMWAIFIYHSEYRRLPLTRHSCYVLLALEALSKGLLHVKWNEIALNQILFVFGRIGLRAANITVNSLHAKQIIYLCHIDVTMEWIYHRFLYFFKRFQCRINLTRCWKVYHRVNQDRKRAILQSHCVERSISFRQFVSIVLCRCTRVANVLPCHLALVANKKLIMLQHTCATEVDSIVSLPDTYRDQISWRPWLADAMSLEMKVIAEKAIISRCLLIDLNEFTVEL